MFRVGCLIGALACCACGGSEPQRPNIVLLVIDTLRADRVGSYGFSAATTPELDALANSGVRFRRVVAQSSWTRPSIASMLTSQHPRTLGIYEQPEDALGDEALTLSEVLRGQGYTTLGATANPNVNASYNFQQGFDYHRDSTVLFKWMEAADGVPTKAESSLPGTAEILAALLERVEATNRPPYYLQATLMEVHEALDPRLDLAPFDGEFLERPDHRYLQALRFVSAAIGRFVEDLASRPGWEDTLFVITSDHGQGLLDHPDVPGSAGHGALLYESQVLVPWILYDTQGRLGQGVVMEQPVRLMELAPTVLEHARIPIPESMEGVSLLPWIRESATQPQMPSSFVVETQQYGERIALYAEGWEYYEHRAPHPGCDSRELQSAGAPQNGARTNRLDQEPALAARLRDELDAWERDHPRQPPTPRSAPLEPAELDQLRALGYLD